MGYLFLALALFTGVTKGYCGKRLSAHTTDTKKSIFVTTVRMVLCVVIGFVAVLAAGALHDVVPSGKLLFFSALSGISTGMMSVLWLAGVRRSAYMLFDVFNMGGMLIPILGGLILFGETVSLTQCIGLALLFLAAVLMCSYNNSIKVKMTLSGFLILVGAAASSGVTDFSQKLFVKYLPDVSATVFNLYTYIFALIALLIASLFTRSESGEDGKGAEKMPNVAFVYVAIMALCLFLNSYFKTLAAARLDAAILYPVCQGGALILSTAMSAIFFKERITPKAVAGLITAFAGLIFINVL